MSPSRSLSLAAASMHHMLLGSPAVLPGQENLCRGQHPIHLMRTAVQRQPWGRWRRLLLRLFVSNFLRSAQELMESTRMPQLRDARRLQHRRERLEKEALRLAVQEQLVIREAASSSAPPQADLTTAREEDRVRPRACVKGHGKYLIPCLEKSIHCSHAETSHGANKYGTFHKCAQCRQTQRMPLTSVTELHVWNQTLVFIPDAFYDKKNTNKATKEKKNPEEESPSSPPKRSTAYKSRAKPVPLPRTPQDQVKDELDEVDEQQTSWHDVMASEILSLNTSAQSFNIGEDVWMQGVPRQAHQQDCHLCPAGEQGMLTLHRHMPTQKLIWKCDNPACRMNWSAIANQVEPAHGTYLCFRCNRQEILVINGDPDPQSAELQCTWEPCSQQAFMFEMDLAYKKMGPFSIEKLQN